MSVWRYTCPEGHVNWRANSKNESMHCKYDNASPYYCNSCDQGFEKLVDQKTKEKVKPSA